MGLEIKCDRCNCVLEHVCNESIKDAVLILYSFAVECKPDFTKSDYYEEGDENAPFLSEAFLYNLLGKEDARTVMALINNVVRAAGLDPHALYHEAYARYEQREKERQERVQQMEERRRKRLERAEKK